MPTFKILVVERESIIALDLQKRLQKVGYSVPAIANSGNRAINLAAAISPDLVLMDFRLIGELDGVKAADQISARFNIPVIYLTTRKLDESLETFRYICKPFTEKELYIAIEIALAKNTTSSQFGSELDADAALVRPSKALLPLSQGSHRARRDALKRAPIDRNVDDLATGKPAVTCSAAPGR